MKILITICARGGSKGLPGKNIKSIAGKPLIAHSIEHALEFAKVNPDTDLFLSTDSEEIRQVAAEHGLFSSYTRPESLAGDTIGKVAVIRDALNFAEKQNNTRYDLVLDLDVTSPLRTMDDLKGGLERSLSSEKLVLFSVNEAHKNPYFNMVEYDGKNYKISKESEGFLSRQSAPKVYEINGSFYIYKRTFFESDIQKVTENGVFDVFVMDHVCHDVDNEVDFIILETFMKQLMSTRSGP